MKLAYFLLGLVVAVHSAPHEHAEPTETIRLIDLRSLHVGSDGQIYSDGHGDAHKRLRRQAYLPQHYGEEELKPVQEEEEQAEPEEAASEHHGQNYDDSVDFGAHTGNNGAFGWYADFPVHGHH